MRKLLPTVLAGALAAASISAAAQQASPYDTHSTTFSQTIFFGDSLTDAGFFRPLLPLNAQPVIGQFTTNPGMVWSQFVANYYDTPTDPGWMASPTGPQPASGSIYAVGGARAGVPVTGQLGPIPSVAQQVQFYLGRTGGKADPNALYSVWAGANDVFAVTAGAPAQATIGAAVTSQVGVVAQLTAAGARYILVPTLPDIGSTPAFKVQGAQAMAAGTQLSTAYNDALFKGLAGQGLHVIPLNTFGLLREIAASPAAYGFRNVDSTACLPAYTASSLTCNPTSYAAPDAASSYAFADGVHPSTAAHKILGEYAIATIEAPRQIAVLPASASFTGRNRAEALNRRLSSLDGSGEGMRWWVDGRIDQQRHARGETGDGFDGPGPALGAGIGWNSGALRYGAALNASRQRVDYGARRGGFRQNDLALTGFAGWHGAQGWVNAQLGYARVGFDVSRDVHLGPAVRTHTGSAKGRNLSFGVDGGWMFGEGALRHGPVASLLLQDIKLDGYTESEPALSTALAFPNQSFKSKQATLGYEVRFSANGWQPYVRVAAELEFGKMPAQASASMPSVPSALSYNVPGVKFDRSYGVLGLGVRREVAGFEIQTGTYSTIAREGGNLRSFSLSIGKAF